MNKPTEEELERAFLDVLAGRTNWYDIAVNTGLPKKRCKELQNIYYAIRTHNGNNNLRGIK